MRPREGESLVATSHQACRYLLRKRRRPRDHPLDHLQSINQPVRSISPSDLSIDHIKATNHTTYWLSSITAQLGAVLCGQRATVVVLGQPLFPGGARRFSAHLIRADSCADAVSRAVPALCPWSTRARRWRLMCSFYILRFHRHVSEKYGVQPEDTFLKLID